VAQSHTPTQPPSGLLTLQSCVSREQIFGGVPESTHRDMAWSKGVNHASELEASTFEVFQGLTKFIFDVFQVLETSIVDLSQGKSYSRSRQILRSQAVGYPRPLIRGRGAEHPTRYTPHLSPHTLHRTPCTLHPTPHTLHSTPYTPQPTPYTLHPAP